MGEGAGSAGRRRDFGSGVLLEDAVQGLDVAGALIGQLIGHGALGVRREGGGALANVLAFAFQVLVQQVAAEGREILLWPYGTERTKRALILQ